MVFLKKLLEKNIWKRIFFERLTEPIHLNLLSFFIWIFGTFRAKVKFDLVLRHHNAFCILNCAQNALERGLKSVTLIEFGVASGAGLMNMAHLSSKIEKITGIKFNLVGFDLGLGMPPPKDFRDHPDLYGAGDFPMDYNSLRSKIPPETKIILGPIEETVQEFIQNLPDKTPIGYVVIDVDYYCSTVAALKVFKDKNPEKYLPLVQIYFDDIDGDRHNSYCGELLAIKNFNEDCDYRKIERYQFFKTKRVFQRAKWIDHVFQLQVLDHPTRFSAASNLEKQILKNPYI